MKKYINNYPLIFKEKVVNYYNKKCTSVKNLLNIFGVSNGSLYNWINNHKLNILANKKQYKKVSKYTPQIKCYIRNYILSKNVFKMNNLINSLKRKYNLIGKKTSVYTIIKRLNLTHKKINNKFNHGIKINQFKKQINKLNKDDIISIDESSLDTHISNLYGWCIKGQKLGKPINMCN
jgi:transposase